MPNDTHIKWLLEGKSAWNTNRRSQTFSPDFSFSDIYEIFHEACQLDHNGRVRLNGYDLTDANFNGATLKNVDFMKTKLCGAKLGVKSLRGTSFFQTDLTGAEFGSWDFRGMELTLATLKNTDLTHAYLTGADLTQSQIWEADLYSKDEVRVNSTPAMGVNKKITSVAEFIRQCRVISSHDKELTLYFRGERDHNWKLCPSVMRPSHDCGFKLRPKEGEMLRELISRRPEDFRGMTSALEQLVIAQHHGLKTRLLDVTRNPCVALFSACDARDPAGIAHKNDMDGKLHVFAVPQSLVKSFNSDTVSIIANFAKLERNYQGLLLGKTIEAIFDEGPGTGFKPFYSEGMRRLYHFIRQEKPQFEKIIDPKDFFRVFVVEPMQSFERIRAQESAFLISAFHERFEREEIMSRSKGVPIYNQYTFIVPQENKKDILDELSLLNFTREILYPSLDEVANAITRRLTAIDEQPNTAREDFPGWNIIEATGARDEPPTECERCGNPGTPRQQFEHMGVTICNLCTSDRANDLQTAD